MVMAKKSGQPTVSASQPEPALTRRPRMVEALDRSANWVAENDFSELTLGADQQTLDGADQRPRSGSTGLTPTPMPVMARHTGLIDSATSHRR
jgi:hypothetical protein